MTYNSKNVVLLVIIWNIALFLQSCGTTWQTTYFNDCVSKNELRAVFDDKFNEILQQITNLAKRIEDVEQRHPEPRPEDAADDDLFEEDDGDAEAEAEAGARRRAEDARNRNRFNFNRHGMGGNNQGNNDSFSKTKFKIPPFLVLLILKYI